MPKILADPGDFLLIPLPDGRYAHGQYLYYHREYATLVQILHLVTEEPAKLSDIESAGPLFPPVFVGLNVPVREGFWTKVGHRDIGSIQFPTFRCTQLITHGLEPGTYQDWLLWDGEKYMPLGKLPVEYRALEYLAGWSSDALERRIATGHNHPFELMF